ncbi:MAG TPA: class I SAM-dependent methyltransferase [Terriglobales bacterium]|nr:class I SAM-dependent methyltransferase [Terriglobales bacterium]
MSGAASFDFVPVDQCYVCGNRSRTPAFERWFFGRKFCWVRCRECELVYQESKLSRESLQRIYNSTFYWKTGEGPQPTAGLGYTDYLSDDRPRTRQAYDRMRTVSRFLPRGSKILDVACATGSFVKAARDAGMDARGVDLSEEMARAGREKYGVEIEVADFDFLEAPPGSLDGITMWGSDSNFYDPAATFRKARVLLRDGGFLFFSFWDFDHPTRPLLGEFKLAHNALYQWNRKNLSRLLETIGLPPRRIAMEWQHVTLDYVCSMTGRESLRRLLASAGLKNTVVRMPTLSGFIVVAQKA